MTGDFIFIFFIFEASGIVRPFIHHIKHHNRKGVGLLPKFDSKILIT